MPRKFIRRYKRKTKISKAVTDKHILKVVHKGASGPGKITKFHRMVRYSDLAGNVNVTSNNLLINFYAKAFRLNEISGLADFTGLYDHYCIDKVTLYFYPVSNPYPTTGTNNEVGQLITAIDYDDDTVPALLSEVLENEHCRVHNSAKPFKMSLRPRCAKPAFVSTIAPFGYTMGDAGTWIDLANADVPHYGIKMAFTTSTVNAETRFNIWMRFDFCMRGVR